MIEYNIIQYLIKLLITVGNLNDFMHEKSTEENGIKICILDRKNKTSQIVYHNVLAIKINSKYLQIWSNILPALVPSSPSIPSIVKRTVSQTGRPMGYAEKEQKKKYRKLTQTIEIFAHDKIKDISW